MQRVYVTVYVAMTADGRILPRVVEWIDGRKYEVERIFDMRSDGITGADSGIRYICQISGKRRELFLVNSKPIQLPGGVIMRKFPGARWYVMVG